MQSQGYFERVSPSIALCLLFACTGCNGTVSTDEQATGVYIEGGVRAADMQPDEVTAKAREFFSNWLKEHGETDVVNDETGVGLERSQARLWAFGYGDPGESTEIEFRIVLPDGREIQEFLSGFTTGDEDGTNMVFANFCMSTFHTIHASFLNPKDEHLEHLDVTIGGKDFYYTSTGIFALGGEDLPAFGNASDRIRKVIETHGPVLSDKPHWVKVVYGAAAGEPIVVSVTLDNSPEDSLTNRIGELDWPNTEGFYMAKEFIVLRPR